MNKIKLIPITDGGQNIASYLVENFSDIYEKVEQASLSDQLISEETVLVIGTLGGETCPKNLQDIQSNFAHHKDKLNFVITMPFTLEGKMRTGRAKRNLESLKQSFSNILVFQNNDMFGYDKSLTYAECFDQMSMQIHNTISKSDLK